MVEGSYTKMSNPSAEEGLRYSFCCDVRERNGFRPASEMLQTCEKIGESSSWR